MDSMESIGGIMAGFMRYRRDVITEPAARSRLASFRVGCSSRVYDAIAPRIEKIIPPIIM